MFEKFNLDKKYFWVVLSILVVSSLASAGFGYYEATIVFNDEFLKVFFKMLSNIVLMALGFVGFLGLGYLAYVFYKEKK